jgi:4-amino-4-deoxy-L-arabinose transferase-like glycosyltransferase
VLRHHEGIGDFFYYHRSANALAEGRGFIDPFLSTPGDPYPSALHPPLWPFLLAGASKLGATSFLAHRLVGAIPGTLTVVLIGLLGRRVAGERAGLLAAATAAAYPTLVAADGSLMSETLYGTFVAASLVLAYRLLDRPSVSAAAALGAAIGLAALTRGEAVLFLVLLALPVAWRGGRPGRPMRLAATLVAAGLVIAPWTVRNWIQFDRLILISTNDATVVAGANCALVYSGPDIGTWDIGCISPVRRELDEAEQTSIWRREGRRYAREHLDRLAIVVPVRVLRTWGLYQPRRQANLAEGGAQWVKYLATAAYYALLVLAVIGVVLLRRRRAPLIVLLSPAIVVTLSSAASFGLPRFRQAAEIAIVTLAAVAIDELLARRRATRARAVPA